MQDLFIIFLRRNNFESKTILGDISAGYIKSVVGSGKYGIEDIRQNNLDVKKALILDLHGIVLSSMNPGNMGTTREEYKLSRHGILPYGHIKLREISMGNALELSAGIILDKVRVGTVVVQFSLDSIAAEIRHITLRALLIGAIFLLLGLFISWPIVRTIVRPIRELNINARKIGNGDLNAKVKVNSRDEVGELAGSFNLMAGKLNRTMSDLQKHMDDLEYSEVLLRESEKNIGISLKMPLKACSRLMLVAAS